ncbi:hypothetical protein Lal_00017286 [Lupinus albus]|nr:hypothetical protein Lal_00017286 [Lupinus albus]
MQARSLTNIHKDSYDLSKLIYGSMKISYMATDILFLLETSDLRVDISDVVQSIGDDLSSTKTKDEVCKNVLNVSIDAIPDSINELKQYFINILLQLGWDSISGEHHTISLLRGEVFLALAIFDHDKTHKEAIRRFQISLDDRNTTQLSANTRRAAYISVIRNTTTESRSGLESLLSLYRTTDILQERERILLEPVSIRHYCITISFLKSTTANLTLRFVSVCFHINNNTASEKNKIVVNSNEKADEIEAFFASNVNPSIVMNLKLSIEQIRIKARWIQSVKQEQSLPDLIKQLAKRK